MFDMAGNGFAPQGYCYATVSGTISLWSKTITCHIKHFTWCTTYPCKMFDMAGNGFAPQGYCYATVSGTNYYWPVWVQL
jgi:hypothetical protein